MSAKQIIKQSRECVDNERGAALVIVLIAFVGLTALAAAGVVSTGSDLQIAENMDASTRAFLAADAGLQSYIGSSTDGTSGATYTPDSLTTVTVTPRKLTEIAGGRVLYSISSTAVHVPAPGDTATRTVAAAELVARSRRLSTRCLSSSIESAATRLIETPWSVSTLSSPSFCTCASVYWRRPLGALSATTAA